MSRSRPILPWLLGLVALAAAAAAVVWMLSGEAPADVGDTAPLTGRDGEAAAPDLPAPSDGRREPPPTAPDPRRLGTITMRLVRPDRRPVEGATIRTLTGTRTGIPGLGTQSLLGRDGESDDDGRARITDVPETVDLLLQATGDGFALTEAGPFRVVAGETTDLGEIIVDPGMTIVGSVVDEADKPVPGAQVRFYQRQVDAMYDMPNDFATQADEQGLFAFPHVRVSEFTLRVQAEGHAAGRHLAFVPPDAQVNEFPVKVRLRKTSPLRGSVVSKEGRPIGGATVEAVPIDPDLDGGRAGTDADGAFEIPGIAAGNYVVTAVADGFAKRSERTWADAYGAPIQLVLPEQGTLSGVVLGDGGAPVKHFELQARFHRRRMDPPSPRFGIQRVSSVDGSFTVRNLDAGFWCVQVWAQGYALTESECVKVPQGHDVGGLVVRPKRGATLHGLVTDAAGAPVPGARVSLHTNREPAIAFLRDTDPDPTLPPAVRTRPDGTWRFNGLAERPYQLEVDHPDFAMLRRDDVQAVAGKETEVPPVQLERGASISGRAVTPGGQPVPGVAVHLSPVHSPTGGGQATTDGQGRFTFTRLPPGEYQLVCYGRNPDLGTLLAAAVGENKPQPFPLARGESLTRNVTVLE